MCYRAGPFSELPRPRRRLTELLVKSARARRRGGPDERRTWSLRFLRSPLEALGDADGRVAGLRLAVNALDGDGVRDTGETERIDCQLLLRSTGSVAGHRGTGGRPGGY